MFAGARLLAAEDAGESLLGVTLGVGCKVAGYFQNPCSVPILTPYTRLNLDIYCLRFGLNCALPVVDGDVMPVFAFNTVFFYEWPL